MKLFTTTFVAAIVLGGLASANQPKYLQFAGSGLFLDKRELTCGATCTDCGSNYIDCGTNGCYAPDLGQARIHPSLLFVSSSTMPENIC